MSRAGTPGHTRGDGPSHTSCVLDLGVWPCSGCDGQGVAACAVRVTCWSCWAMTDDGHGRMSMIHPSVGAAVPFPPVMADIWSRGTRLSQKLELGVLILFIISPPITRPTRYSLDWTWPEKGNPGVMLQLRSRLDEAAQRCQSRNTIQARRHDVQTRQLSNDDHQVI